MRVQLLVLSIVLSICSYVYGQDTWETWDSRYSLVDFKEVILFEKNYADSIEKNTSIPQYYSRKDTYKIIAEYTGEFRSIYVEVLNSMKRVFKLLIGNPVNLDKIIKEEALFRVDGKDVWMPIQDVLVTPLKKEIEIGASTILYCLFLNEHSNDGKLFNTFFISEFREK
jgi:hypothetical protein